MLQVPNEMGAQYHDVLSAQDVAIYGGLCALASFDRQELRNHVINNISFRDYMEVNPEVKPPPPPPPPISPYPNALQYSHILPSTVSCRDYMIAVSEGLHTSSTVFPHTSS